MNFFHPALMQVRGWLKPFANMKNAMSLNSALTGIVTRSGLPSALRGTVRGWGMSALAVIVISALALSLLSRYRREDWKLRPDWRGRSQALGLLLALLPLLALALMRAPMARLWMIPAGLSVFSLHRLYLRRYATAVLQILGCVPFVGGAFLLGEARMMDFIALTDEVVGGVVLFVIGLVFVVWRLLDLFLILFGGLTPRKKKS